MYFSSAEEWENVGHKDNIVIESPFLIPSCVLHFWKAWSSGGWADQSSACFFFRCLVTLVNFSTCQVHGGLWNFKANSMLHGDASDMLDFWVHPEMNKSWSHRKLQLKNPNLDAWNIRPGFVWLWTTITAGSGPHLNCRSAIGKTKKEKRYLWNMCLFQGTRLIFTDLKWNYYWRSWFPSAQTGRYDPTSVEMEISWPGFLLVPLLYKLR